MNEGTVSLVCRLQPTGVLGQFLPSSRGQRGTLEPSYLSSCSLTLTELQTKGAAKEDVLQAASPPASQLGRRGAGDNSPWQPFPWQPLAASGTTYVTAWLQPSIAQTPNLSSTLVPQLDVGLASLGAGRRKGRI